RKPASLLVPTRRDLLGTSHPIDHFLCYDVKPQQKLSDGTLVPAFPKGVQMVVEDQLQARRYDLTGITKLCNPVSKAGNPVVLKGPTRGQPFPITPAAVGNPGESLVCYRAKLAKKSIQQNGCGSLEPGS